MELIYMYVERFNNIIFDEEINFSPNFQVEISEHNLIINSEPTPMVNFFGGNARNLTALVGKNGSGKTTFLDILGMNRSDRKKLSIKREGFSSSPILDSYLILYHIENDYYGIEVIEGSIFSNRIQNVDFENSIKDPFYKLPIGLIMKYDGSVCKFVKHYSDYYKGDKNPNRTKIHYISHQYSNRINPYWIESEEEERQNYLFSRSYTRRNSKKLQYIYASQLSERQSKMEFLNDSIIMEITPKFDYRSKEDGNEESWIKELEERLYLRKKPSILPQLKEDIDPMPGQFKPKDSFVLDMLSRYIMDLFFNGVCGFIDDLQQNHDEIAGYGGLELDIQNEKHRCFLEERMKTSNVGKDDVLGKITSKEIELKNLITAMDFYRGLEVERYQELKYICRYLSTRTDSYVELGEDNKYHIAIEEFIDCLIENEESYFVEDGLIINVEKDVDENLIETLEVYDKWVNSDYNNLSYVFKIEFKNISEGQKYFLDLLGKIFYPIECAEDKELSLIIIDEPDIFMHPEWCRRFIDILCQELALYSTKNVQFVMSTHSPFILSDFPSSNVVFLCYEDGKCKIIDKDIKTFGANIHELLMDGFFMESTLGEYAKKKIESVIEYLIQKKTNQEIENRKFSHIEIQNIIDIIGEPVISNKLQHLFFEVFSDFHNLELKEKELEYELQEIRKLKEKSMQAGDNKSD